MEVSIQHNGKYFKADLTKGIDLSIPIKTGYSVNAYFAHPVKMEPYISGDWIGEVKRGGSVNYRNISFNPHGNGTHTECVGHIDETIHSINQHFKAFHCVAQLISVTPEKQENGDLVITETQLPVLEQTEAVIIRTLPNDVAKQTRNYSGSNPPYVDHKTIVKLVQAGCKHLILDLPSVDREEDDGKLLSHKAFWNFSDSPRVDCSITELAYIPNEVKDGLYLLNLQVAPFENDAAPSRPLVFPLTLV